MCAHTHDRFVCVTKAIYNFKHELKCTASFCFNLGAIYSQFDWFYHKSGIYGAVLEVSRCCSIGQRSRDDVICHVTGLMGGRGRVKRRWWGLKDISPGRAIISRKECEVLIDGGSL